MKTQLFIRNQHKLVALCHTTSAQMAQSTGHSWFAINNRLTGLWLALLMALTQIAWAQGNYGPGFPPSWNGTSTTNKSGDEVRPAEAMFIVPQTQRSARVAASQTIVFNAVGSGWYSPDYDGHNAGNPNYVVGGDGVSYANTYRNFLAFNLASLDLTGKKITSAKLVLQSYTSSAGLTYIISDVTTNQTTLLATHDTSDPVFASIYEDLASGTSYGTFTDANTTIGSGLRTYELNAAALTNIAASAGGAFSVGGKLQSATREQYLFGFSSAGTRQLILEVADANSITTTALPNSTLCVGSAQRIAFSATGTFGAGNVFTAQLSDAAGSFAAPTAIGTLTGTTSGTINATIPANTVPGTGYRIRVVSSQPAITGSDIGVTIAALPTPSIVGLASSYCKDAAPVTLSGSPAGGTFTIDGTPATQLNPALLTVGDHTVVYSYTNSSGCSNTASQVVTIKAVPNAPSLLTQTGQSYPGGQSSVTVDLNTGNVNLVISGCSGTISWTGPNNASGNSSPIMVPTTQPGTYVYQATCTANGCTSQPASATVTVRGRLTVLHRDVDNYADNNAIQPLLQLQNQGTGPLPLANLTLRYYLTVEGSAALSNLSINYAQVGNQNVRLRYVPLTPAQAGAQGYVEVGFTPTAGTLAAGANSGSIQAYFAKSDYSALNELDDYSYATVRDQLVSTLRITAYYNGTLISGIEPGAPATSIRSLRALTESKNGPSATQINTFLEVRNEGNVPVNYSDLKVRYYFTADGNERLQVEVDEGNVQAQLVKLTTPLTNADTYLELTFTRSGQLAPGASTGTIRYRISKPDGGRFNQTNDWSYQEQPADRSQNPRVPVFVGDELVWGQLPGASARVAASVEPGTELTVLLRGNPVQGGQLTADVTGAAGQPLTTQLTDLQGRVVARQHTEAAGQTERVSLSVGQSAPGLLLLQVSTPTQSRTVKVLKAE